MVEKREEQEKTYFTWEDFDKAAKSLVRKIKASKRKYHYIYGIPRGGLPMAVKLSHLLKIPLTANYGDIRKQAKLLIVDDISDSGDTLSQYNMYNNKNDYVVTIHYKRKSLAKPDFYYKIAKEKDWIAYPWEE